VHCKQTRDEMKSI